jgi:hypothetical protein
MDDSYYYCEKCKIGYWSGDHKCPHPRAQSSLRRKKITIVLVVICISFVVVVCSLWELIKSEGG